LSAPQCLVTERLVLRRWRDGDIAALARLNADPEVMRYFPRTYGFDETKARVASWSKAFETRGYAPWAVEIPGLSSCIGFVGPALVEQPQQLAGKMEMAWRLDRPYWKKGYATEAAHASMRDVFLRMEPPEIIAYTAAVNIPSRRVMERLGMTQDIDSAFDHPTLEANDTLRAHVVFRLTRQDFLAIDGTR
jgi:RimJ/RimL family protein N-acetyltransferase